MPSKQQEKCNLCGELNKLEYYTIMDSGYDHQTYAPKEIEKSYLQCLTCNSVRRLDQQIRNPFIDINYVNTSTIPLNSVKESSGKILVSSFRNQSILNNLRKFSFIESTKTICDFGANKGDLLNYINHTSSSKHKLIGIETKHFASQKYGYKFYSNLKSASDEEKIDVFIASHSLLYTDYDELGNFLRNKISRPESVVIVNPDYIKRPAQLFYDDVITNASPYGLYIFFERHGYEVVHSGPISETASEFIISARLNNASGLTFKSISLRPEKNYKLKESKLKILDTYYKQASMLKEISNLVIFGTSIDSAILFKYCPNVQCFTKDKAKDGEKFMGLPVIDINQINSEKIAIPCLMASFHTIRERLFALGLELV